MSRLEVTDLRITLRATGRPLVDGLTCSLDGGGRLGIIGESGSGKSLSTLAMIGLLPPTVEASGSIELDGEPLLGAPERRWLGVRGGRIAMVFQDPSTTLDPLMPVGRLLAAPLRRHRGLTGSALEAAAVHALAEVALPDPQRILRALPHELSGGQRQRVAIAAALACDPDFLLADEPTTALDVTVQAGVLELLGRLVEQRGMGLVLVSHDLAVVAQAVERVLVMRTGRVVESGLVTELVRDARDPYTQQLVGSARALDDALTSGVIA